MNIVAEPQVMPKEGQKIILNFLLDTLTDNLIGIKTDLKKRAVVGIKRYGTALMSHNGRNATLDLYQELLDGIMYATQAYMESKSYEWDNWYADIIRVLVEQANAVRQYIIEVQGVDLDGYSDEN